MAYPLSQGPSEPHQAWIDWVSDMNTVPADLKDLPVIVRLANSQHAIGQCTREQVQQLGSPGFFSLFVDYGRDNLDAGISIKASYTVNFEGINPAGMPKGRKKTARNDANSGNLPPRVNNHKFKGRPGVNAENGLFQLSDLEAWALTADSMQLPELSCSFKGAPLANIIPFTAQTWVAIKFTVRSAMVTGNMPSDHSWDSYLTDMMKAGVDKHEIDLMTAMFSSPKFTLVAYFIAPKPAREWITTDFKRLQDIVQIHLPPLSPYCRPYQGNTNDWRAVEIGLDFPNPQRFNYGVLLKVPLADRPKIVQAIKDSKPLPRLPGFNENTLTLIPFKHAFFPNVRSARICWMLVPVREHQAQQAALAPLIGAHVDVIPVKAPFIKNLDERAYYFVLRLDQSKMDGTYAVPESDQVFKITARGGRLAGQSFIGISKTLLPAEKAAIRDMYTGDYLDMLVSVGLYQSQVPAGLLAAESFNHLETTNVFKAILEPIVDETTANRTLKAVAACTDETDPAALNNTQAYIPSRGPWDNSH